MEIVQISPCGFVCESEESFGLENKAILRLDSPRKLTFLLFSKIKGFLREQFTLEYLSTYKLSTVLCKSNDSEINKL